MFLYHASTMIVEKPVIMNRFTTLDFGTGFYTTSNEDQAQDFARKVYLRRKRQGKPLVNRYLLDEKVLESLDVLQFPAPDKQWLEFVVHNRREGRDPSLAIDLVIGPVANDDVFQAVALYEDGVITEEEAIRRFKAKELFDQYLFCNEKALEYLKFDLSYTVAFEEGGPHDNRE